MTWRIWSPVGSTSSSNASFETSFSSDAPSALDEKQRFAHTNRASSLVAGNQVPARIRIRWT